MKKYNLDPSVDVSHKAANKRYYNKNKDMIAEKKRLWYIENPDYNKNYYEANKPEILQKGLIYQKKKRKQDPAYRLLVNVRKRFTELFCKARDGLRVGSFEDYFGEDEEVVLVHIESQFKNDMNWDNHGEIWQLDHIVPLSLGAGDKDFLLKLCHYKNLQPLYNYDNKIKHNSIDFERFPAGVPFSIEEVKARMIVLGWV